MKPIQIKAESYAKKITKNDTYQAYLIAAYTKAYNEALVDVEKLVEFDLDKEIIQSYEKHVNNDTL